MHFYNSCYLCHYPFRVYKPVRVLLFSASSAGLLLCCWGWSLTAGAETEGHHICSPTLIQEPFRIHRVKVSNLWFSDLKNLSFWCTLAEKEAEATRQTHFDIFCRFRTNKWGVWRAWNPAACRPQQTPFYFSAKELKIQWVRAFQFFFTEYLGTIFSHLLKGTQIRLQEQETWKKTTEM